jgi:uncharacterized protein with PQ loop repeat
MQLTKFINQVFSMLVRQHYVLYVFVGLILGYIFVFNAGYQAIVNICKSLGNEIVFFSVLICVLYAFFVYFFYGKAIKYVQVTRYGVVVKDLYFPTRIASNISLLKKVSGYSYVIFRIAHLMLHGFAAGVALFMLEVL